MNPDSLLNLAKRISDDAGATTPPDDGVHAQTHQVVPPAIVRGTRGYIEKVTNQINGMYEMGWYDGCAVMMRRLLETLIIEAFEKHSIESTIKNPAGDYLFLRDLINRSLAEPSWTLSRNTKAVLPGLKDLGDKSAHSRRYVAHRQDIESIKASFRGVVQEFVYLADLK